MTDIPIEPTPEPLGPAAAGLPHLTPEQVADARTAWKSYGLDEAAFDAAVTAPTEARQGAAPSPGHVQATVDALRASGQQDEAIAATLERHGLTAPDDPRSDTERGYDAAFGAPPSPADYRPAYYERAAGIEDLDAFNREATTWASSMALPVKIGEHVIERSLDVGRWYAQASDAERQTWAASERYDLEARHGVEGAALYLDMATKALAGAPAEFTERLRASGALHSREIVTHLALHGARLQRRAG